MQALSIYYASKEKNEGVSDMFFFRRFGSINPDLVCELMISIDNHAVDNNMNNSDDFILATNGIKKIEFKEQKTPLGILAENGKAVCFIALHFQGRAKEYISDYLTCTTSNTTLLQHKLLWLFKDMKEVLQKFRRNINTIRPQ